MLWKYIDSLVHVLAVCQAPLSLRFADANENMLIHVDIHMIHDTCCIFLQDPLIDVYPP